MVAGMSGEFLARSAKTQYGSRLMRERLEFRREVTERRGLFHDPNAANVFRN
jgi:hypothetical protein